MNFFGSQQINEVLTNLLPVSKDDKLSEDEKWIGKQCILIRDGINLLEMQSLNIPEEYSLDSTITFIESIDLEKLKNESSDIAIKSFKKIRAANESDKRINNDCYIPTPYELFHIKMYQRFKDIDNIYIENKKKFEKKS
ncbi:MAG: hypothetical protein OMM_08280 [Candidatus Magnetoglobus multicellularis str. Araruama]|uniref:Uncharacterized protein n=1 Tax=Candidatus Magnetoglobus multicellularis str. Araruama TaxID=890399 RepID=A0A1V1P8T9_9BACT|nr:MAG: hypothetical protein OMM_08280 [Candidatus Magnetoglobus multicellularis str. Araruama]